MNYPPKIYQSSSETHLLEVIKNYPLATVISVENETPLISHLPLIYKAGKLIGHLDKNNPQAQLLGNNTPVTVIFSGPDCYISPNIFKSKQLPTWNYVKVHITGTAKEITDPEEIKSTMVAMTSFLEQPEMAYTLKQDDPRMEKFMAYVTGFEINILSYEGKFKLSQDKSLEDREQAKKQLLKSNTQVLEQFLNTLLTDA